MTHPSLELSHFCILPHVQGPTPRFLPVPGCCAERQLADWISRSVRRTRVAGTRPVSAQVNDAADTAHHRVRRRDSKRHGPAVIPAIGLFSDNDRVLAVDGISTASHSCPDALQCTRRPQSRCNLLNPVDRPVSQLSLGIRSFRVLIPFLAIHSITLHSRRPSVLRQASGSLWPYGSCTIANPNLSSEYNTLRLIIFRKKI